MGRSVIQGDYARFRQLFLEAIHSPEGERIGLITAMWSLAGRCASPIGLEQFGRPTDRFNRPDPSSTPLRLIMQVRCRKCPACLRFRAWVWRTRGELEIRLSSRTWFGTLTLRPEEQYRHLLEARSLASKRSIDFDQLTEDEQFLLRHESISKEITKYFKRLRKQSGAYLRYLLCVEAHKSGLPHYHLLIHEVTDVMITKRVLQEQWTLGFSDYKLAEKAAAAYVTKYLTKSSLARVRASLRYGKTLA